MGSRFSGLFRSLLIVGVFLGIGFFIAEYLSNEAGTSGGTNLPIPTHGQVNVLFIGVEHFTDQPSLESVWLVSYFRNHPQVILTPIYPAAPDSTPGTDALIRRSFAIDRLGNPDKKFLKTIEQLHKTWANYYVMSEDIGLIAIIEFMGGVEIGHVQKNGLEALDYLPKAQDDPVGALRAQTTLLKKLCAQANVFDPARSFAPVFEMVPRYIRTDMDIQEVVGDFRGLITQSRPLECEFPLLESGGE